MLLLVKRLLVCLVLVLLDRFRWERCDVPLTSALRGESRMLNTFRAVFLDDDDDDGLG